MRDHFVAVMAAHVATTNANAHAHPAQGAANDAAPGGELFASLLVKTGDSDETDAKTDKDAGTDSGKAHGKLKKSKGSAADSATNLVDMRALPAHLAALNAKFASANGKPAKSGHAANDIDAVGAADAGKDGARDTSSILSRIMDAKSSDKTAPAKDAGKKSPGQDIGSDGDETAAAAAHASPKDAHGSTAKGDKTGTGQTAEIASAADTPPTGDAGKADADHDKKSTKDHGAESDAAKDAQASVPDKAAALAAAVDKNTRQAGAAQDTQTRALPVHLQAQVTEGKDSDGNKPGSDSKGSPQAQHAKNDTDAQPRADAVRPAAQAPLNTAGATPPVSHTPSDTTNVQPVTAQTQTQVSPTVTASLQVGPQIAAQAQVPPDVTSLAIQIAAKSQEGSKQFDIRLDPPELGRVDVKLSIDDTGRAQAHLSVEKPQTLDLLQHDRSSLERALKDSGVDLSQNGLNFSLKGQEKQSDNSTPFRGRSRNLAVTAAIETTSAAVAASTNSFAAGNTRLDIRV